MRDTPVCVFPRWRPFVILDFLFPVLDQPSCWKRACIDTNIVEIGAGDLQFHARNASAYIYFSQVCIQTITVYIGGLLAPVKRVHFWSTQLYCRAIHGEFVNDDDDDDDEIAYFTVRWKTRASFVYRTKNMR